jgi:hypothetical protein
MLLLAVFMAGYYFMDAPVLTHAGEDRAEEIERAELKSLLECILHAHSDAITVDERTAANQKQVFASEIPCAERYEIATVKLCSDDRRITPDCTPDRADKTISNYVITTTSIITENDAGKILELLGRDYPYAANFGIISIGEDNVPRILSSGGTKREISKQIAKEAAFADGQLAYITQYSVGGKKNAAIANQIKKIKCAAGDLPVFRHNQWTCAASNVMPVCGGDNIWDAEAGACRPDNSRRPLCRQDQAAVMIDEVWECVDPQKDRECPKGMNAELDYESMEWICVSAAAARGAEDKKCSKVYDRLYDSGTKSLRGNLVSCNDCEKMIVHDDCTAECVPDAAKTGSRACYAGACQNFYFGFPDKKYIANAMKNIPDLAGASIPLDAARSRNRKFNCAECPGGINEVESLPPYVIICR